MNRKRNDVAVYLQEQLNIKKPERQENNIQYKSYQLKFMYAASLIVINNEKTLT